MAGKLTEISITPETTPLSALNEAVDLALSEEKPRYVDVRMYERSVGLGASIMNEVVKGRESFGEDARVSYLMNRWSMLTAYMLPRPDTPLEKASPFRSENLDRFLNTPFQDQPFSSAYKQLHSVQTDYIAYLFNRLAQASTVNDNDTVYECVDRIYHGVVLHITNSGEYLNAERRQTLIAAFDKCGKLNAGLETRILGAGTGPNPWTQIAEQYGDDEFVWENVLPFIPKT